MSLFAELKRRNVLRVGAAYIVTSWLLIQVAETIFPLFGFGDGPARIVVIVLAIGFIPALVVSWAFELTPEGFRRESRIDDAQPAAPHEHKKLDRLIMVVLALALGYFAVDKFVFEPARDAAREAEITKKARTEAIIDSYGRNSLAVLPFVNMSNDAENEYFSDGVAEEVLNLLAKIPDLRVISRSSSFTYRGKDIDIPTVAEQLNVALVLEGSVRRYGNQVRITAQLIEARSDTHLWSETYERELENVFAIQDEISASIVQSLRETINLDVDEAPRTTAAANKEAHDAYLRGQYLLAQRGAAVIGAVAEFEKAIELDPDYALAHAQLSLAYQLGGRGLGMTSTESLSKASPHVEKAMALDPDLAEANAAAGFLSWSMEEEHEALKHLERAIRINPNYADAYTWMANILDWSLGRYSEAFAMREKAVQLDPLSIPALVNYIGQLFFRGKFTEVDRELEKLASLSAGHHALLRLDRIAAQGNWADAGLGQLDLLLTNPDDRLREGLTYVFALLGLENEALAGKVEPEMDALRMLGKSEQAVTKAQAQLDEDPLDVWRRVEFGTVLAGAGDFGKARPYLEEAWQKWGRVFVGPRFNVENATALVAVRRAAGEEDTVADLLAAIQDNVRRYTEAGITTTTVISPDYEAGLARFFAGEEQSGLALIARAVEDGYFIMQHEAYLRDLYQHPDFAAIRAVQEARQAREREKFLAVVCVDNPYGVVWEPAAATCEGFTAPAED